MNFDLQYFGPLSVVAAQYFVLNLVWAAYLCDFSYPGHQIISNVTHDRANDKTSTIHVRSGSFFEAIRSGRGHVTRTSAEMTSASPSHVDFLTSICFQKSLRCHMIPKTCCGSSCFSSYSSCFSSCFLNQVCPMAPARAISCTVLLKVVVIKRAMTVVRWVACL